MPLCREHAGFTRNRHALGKGAYSRREERPTGSRREPVGARSVRRPQAFEHGEVRDVRGQKLLPDQHRGRCDDEVGGIDAVLRSFPHGMAARGDGCFRGLWNPRLVTSFQPDDSDHTGRRLVAAERRDGALLPAPHRSTRSVAADSASSGPGRNIYEKMPWGTRMYLKMHPSRVRDVGGRWPNTRSPWRRRKAAVHTRTRNRIGSGSREAQAHRDVEVRRRPCGRREDLSAPRCRSQRPTA
jgi:hypothetical protein